MIRKSWMSFTKVAFVVFILLTVGLIGTSTPAIAGKIISNLVTLDTRQGVTQTFVLLTPENPTASLILFSGLFGDIQAGGKEEQAINQIGEKLDGKSSR